MRISDWSSDVCSSDLHRRPQHPELDVQYGPHHPVTLRPAGPLAALAKAAGVTGTLMVNSLRSEERRVGNACARTCRSRRSPPHSTNTNQPHPSPPPPTPTPPTPNPTPPPPPPP